MTNMTPEKLYTLLHHNITKAKANGYKVVTGAFGSPLNKTCCAFTANTDWRPTEGWAPLTDRYGLTEHQLWQVIFGFDNNSTAFKDQWYDVGAELRKDFFLTEF